MKKVLKKSVIKQTLPGTRIFLCFLIIVLLLQSTVQASKTCLSPEFKYMIDRLWQNRKQYFINNINLLSSTGNTNILYNIQGYTNNLLKYADYHDDYEILDGLAEVYLTAYDQLTLATEYTYSYIPGQPKYTTLPLDPPALMWINTAGDPDREIILHSSQFLYAVADAINAILDIDESGRTTNMNELITNYVPVLLNDHYKRWIFADQGIFQVKGWSCDNGIFNHYDFLEKKYHKEFGTLNPFSYCNAVLDTDMWIIAGVVEMLAAHNKDPQLVPLDAGYEHDLLDYVNLGYNLINSRITNSNLTDFDGNPLQGTNFDLGAMDDHSTHDYAGYTGETFPTPADQNDGNDVGWDISHARRFVHVFDTLHKYRDITGQAFPDTNVMIGLANQLLYGASNKNITFPLFTNFMDGTNGWFRVGYDGDPDFGYPPYGLTNSIITGGYGFWAEYNHDMGRIMNSLWDMISSVYIPDYSGNKYDATAFGAEWVGNGRYNGAMQFDGVDDYIDCDSYKSWNSQEGAIEFWFKADLLDVIDDIINIYQDSYYNYFLIRKNDANKIYLGIEEENIHKIKLTSSVVISDTNWHHVVVTQDGFGAKIYIDGANSNATGTNSNYWTNHLTLSGFWVGKGHWSQFKGKIDEIRVYNRSLTSTEVQEHYNANFSNNDGLVSYWPFDDEPNQTVIDFFNEYYKGEYGKNDSLNLLKFLPSFNNGLNSDLPGLMAFAKHWLGTSSVQNWAEGADLNGDKIINLADFVIFADCWLRTSE